MTTADNISRPVLRGQEILPYGSSCPECLKAGNTTNRGETPQLKVLDDAPERPFCITHGYVQVMRTPVERAIAETVARSKEEINLDIEAGTVPPHIADFSALHDYVDANTYGGLCDDPQPFADVFTFDDQGIERVARVQDALDEWIKKGRP